MRTKLEHDNVAQRNRHDDDEDAPTIVDVDRGRGSMAPPPPRQKRQQPEEEEDGIPAEYRAHFPSSFGAPVRPNPNAKQSKQSQSTLNNKGDGDDDDEDEDEIGPPRPPHSNKQQQDDANTEDNEQESYANHHFPTSSSNSRSRNADAQKRSDDSDNEDPWHLPITSEVVLHPHSKAVVALDVDHSGSRLLTGSHDYTVKIFDFNGMKSDCRPFRSFEPTEGHPVVALSWSPTGDAFLVVTGSPQPKVYDRDGKPLGELPRGDMYIRDMKNTKGHVTACSGGAWHPLDKGTGLTCSDDGSLRIWDLWTLQQKTVIKPTLVRPGRVAVTACCWAPSGVMLGGGLLDGAVQLWDVRGKFGQSAAIGAVGAPKAQAFVTKQNWSFVSQSGAKHVVRGAHSGGIGSEITCLRFSVDGNTLLSRGADETLKLWDVRKFKTPVAVAEGLPTLFSNTQCCFSPDEKLVLTGISPPGKEGCGAVAVLDSSDLSLVRRIGVPGSAVAVTWQPKINQILVGCGDRKEGTTRVLYDTSRSTRGALLAVGRRPREESASDYVAGAAPQIFNPNALPLYRDVWPGGGGGGGKGKRKAPVDASIRTSKSFKPESGKAGPGSVAKGAGGALGVSSGSLLTQYIMKHQGQLKNPGDEDVRASILRHAGKEDEMSAFTAAYAKTQPKRIYAKEEEEEDENGGGGGGAGAGPSK